MSETSSAQIEFSPSCARPASSIVFCHRCCYICYWRFSFTFESHVLLLSDFPRADAEPAAARDHVRGSQIAASLGNQYGSCCCSPHFFLEDAWKLPGFATSPRFVFVTSAHRPRRARRSSSVAKFFFRCSTASVSKYSLRPESTSLAQSTHIC